MVVGNADQGRSAASSRPRQSMQAPPARGDGVAAGAPGTAGPPAPEPGKCQFYLDKHKRYCSFLVKQGELYCGNHLHIATGKDERVPCPLDPGHTVLASELSVHLKKCPKVKQLLQDKVRGGAGAIVPTGRCCLCC